MKRKLSQRCELPLLPSDNQSKMQEVFSSVGVNLNKLGRQKQNFAVASFNKAFAVGRNDDDVNLDWFKALMGLNRN